MRVLDIDLDFFVHGVEHWASSSGPRLEDDYAQPWTMDEALRFLRERCGLSSRLPGAVVEHHGEMFERWREAIAAGNLEAPFHVTHVDAHADLGLGDAGYVPLCTELLYREVAERAGATGRPDGLDDGNYLAFAVACRWISDLDYVHNDEGGNDLLTIHMQDGNPEATALQLKAVPRSEIDRWLYNLSEPVRPDRLEPAVPFRQMMWDMFEVEAPYDAVCLCRSPGFTPEGCDAIFDEIRRLFIAEDAWSKSSSPACQGLS